MQFTTLVNGLRTAFATAEDHEQVTATSFVLDYLDEYEDEVRELLNDPRPAPRIDFKTLLHGLRLAQVTTEFPSAEEAVDFMIEWVKANEDDIREFLDDPVEED